MKKRFKIAIFLFSTVLFALPLVARASWWQDAFTWVIYAITAVIVWIIGIFLTLGASLTDLMLWINMEHLSAGSNKLIEVGWQITRNLANLGFVLAIIIIAFATIVQYKQYGAKKLLPKLIAAALIVNFSMAIATPVIGFSNTITNFFLGGAAPSVSGPGKVASVIAGAFNPQKLLMDRPEVDPTIPPGMESGGKTGGFGTVFLVSVASALFAITFTTIATITFFAFAFMLMIRYVMLAFLLILAPIAWLAWVVPGLENQFQKWWSNFFKWAFFAPAMSFFIYLALISAQQMKGENMTAVTGENFRAGAMGNLMVHGSQMIILAGLMLGGLIAAQNLSIHGASGAIGVAKKVGNWGTKGAARVARRGALKAGSFAFRVKKGAEGESLAERARTYANTRKKGVWRWTTGLAARGFTNIESLGTERLSEEHEKVVSKWSDDRLLAELPSAMGPRKVAIMKELAKKKKLHKARVRGLVTQGSKNLFARFGQGEKWGDIEKAANLNIEMNEALEAENIDKFKEEAGKFLEKRTKKDMLNMPWKEVFNNIGDDDKGTMGYGLEATRNWAEGLAEKTAEENHVLLSSIVQQLPAKARDAFTKRYEKGIEKISDEKKRKDVRKAYENTMNNYASGGPSTEEKEEKEEKKEEK